MLEVILMLTGILFILLLAAILLSGIAVYCTREKLPVIKYIPDAKPLLIDDERLDRLADLFVKSGINAASDDVVTFQHYLDGVTRISAQAAINKWGVKL